jgi:hypothetical protein
MSIYIYTYVYIHIYTWTYIYKHTYINTYVSPYIYTHICLHIKINTYIYIYIPEGRLWPALDGLFGFTLFVVFTLYPYRLTDGFLLFKALVDVLLCLLLTPIYLYIYTSK